MWKKSKHYGTGFLKTSVLVLFVCLSVFVWAQESMESLPEDSYLISESQKQQLLQLLQTLSDKVKSSQTALLQSEQDLKTAQNQLQLSEDKYNSLAAQYKDLEQAWTQLSQTLDKLSQDSQTLTQSYQDLVIQYQTLVILGTDCLEQLTAQAWAILLPILCDLQPVQYKSLTT